MLPNPFESLGCQAHLQPELIPPLFLRLVSLPSSCLIPRSPLLLNQFNILVYTCYIIHILREYQMFWPKSDLNPCTTYGVSKHSANQCKPSEKKSKYRSKWLSCLIPNKKSTGLVKQCTSLSCGIKLSFGTMASDGYQYAPAWSEDCLWHEQYEQKNE